MTPTPVLREYMEQDDQEREGKRWSYYRDLGTTRLIVVDVRTGRCLDEGERKIVDDDEWDWIVERATEGEFDHLLIGTSDPYLLAPTFHHLEAWNERICAAPWGAAAARSRREDAPGARLRPLGRVRGLVPAPDGADPGDRGGPPRQGAGDDRRALRRRPPRLSRRRRLPPRRGRRQRRLPGASARRTATLSTTGSAARSSSACPSPHRAARPGRSPRPAGVADPDIRWRFARAPTSTTRSPRSSLDGRGLELKLDKVHPRSRGPRRAPRAGLRAPPGLAPRFSSDAVSAAGAPGALLPCRAGITYHFNQERSQSDMRGLRKLRDGGAANAGSADARPRGRKLFAASVLAVGLAGGLAACGGSSDDDSASGSEGGSGRSTCRLLDAADRLRGDRSFPPSRRPPRARASSSRARSARPATSPARSRPASRPTSSTCRSSRTSRGSSTPASSPRTGDEEYDGGIQNSVVVFITRPGNPKDITDWDDLRARRRRRDHAEPVHLGRRPLEHHGRLRPGRSRTAAPRRRRSSSSRTCSRTRSSRTPARVTR